MALCTKVVPCCSNGTLFCTFDTLSACLNHYRTYLVSSLWCATAVDQCLADIQALTCDGFATNGIPDACAAIYENRFEVVPADATCANAGESQCGELGGCIDTQSDSKNCGGCGMACSDDTRCIAGKCSACGAKDQVCCSDDICKQGSCEQGTCKLRACEIPLVEGDPAGAPCPTRCAILDLRADYPSCLTYTAGLSEAAAAACRACLDDRAGFCAQSTCPDAIEAYRCCREGCAGVEDCRQKCGAEEQAFEVCVNEAGCYETDYTTDPIYGCFYCARSKMSVQLVELTIPGSPIHIREFNSHFGVHGRATES